jgi:hypothetical protein
MALQPLLRMLIIAGVTLAGIIAAMAFRRRVIPIRARRIAFGS